MNDLSKKNLQKLFDKMKRNEKIPREFIKYRDFLLFLFADGDYPNNLKEIIFELALCMRDVNVLVKYCEDKDYDDAKARYLSISLETRFKSFDINSAILKKIIQAYRDEFPIKMVHIDKIIQLLSTNFAILKRYPETKEFYKLDSKYNFQNEIKGLFQVIRNGKLTFFDVEELVKINPSLGLFLKTNFDMIYKEKELYPNEVNFNGGPSHLASLFAQDFMIYLLFNEEETKYGIFSSFLEDLYQYFINNKHINPLLWEYWQEQLYLDEKGSITLLTGSNFVDIEPLYLVEWITYIQDIKEEDINSRSDIKLRIMQKITNREMDTIFDDEAKRKYLSIYPSLVGQK